MWNDFLKSIAVSSLSSTLFNDYLNCTIILQSEFLHGSNEPQCFWKILHEVLKTSLIYDSMVKIALKYLNYIFFLLLEKSLLALIPKPGIAKLI